MATYTDTSMPNADPAVYFWTSSTFIQNKEREEYIPVTGDLSVYKDFKVLFAIRVFKKVGSTNKTLYDNNTDGIKVYVLDSWKNSVADSLEVNPVGQITTTRVLSDQRRALDLPFLALPGDDESQENTEEIFYFTVKAKKSNVTFTPKVLVKIRRGSTELPGDSNTQPDAEILPQNSTPFPVIKFTAARSQGSVPAAVKDAAWKGDYITLDKCAKPNQWVAIIKSPDIDPKHVNYLLRRWSLDGYLATGPVETGGTAYGKDEFIDWDYKDQSTSLKTAKLRGAEQKAIKALIAIKANTCGEPVDDTTKETDPSVAANSKPIPVSTSRINPPSHFATRDISHWMRIREKALIDLTGKDPEDINRADLLTRDNTASGRLGMIFQDESSATALNSADNAKNPWGFRFIYNPNSISYNTAMDTSIDWMLSTKDPANYIGGNVSVGFQLYLNRIADMTELAHLKKNPSDYSKNYAGKLQAEDVAGILNRGTEYDLEYLYRVLNGDPKPSNNGLLTYTVGGKPAVTSDFGYITGTPIWVRFHDNLRYKGSVASVSVNHVLFNENMVPMLSVVDISMVRYPIIGETSKEVQDAFAQKAKDYTAAKEAEKAAAAKPST